MIVFSLQLTHKLKAEFGAVRHIYTPTHGREVRSLEDVVDGDDYVAGGNERFKPAEYRRIHSNHTIVINNKALVRLLLCFLCFAQM